MSKEINWGEVIKLAKGQKGQNDKKISDLLKNEGNAKANLEKEYFSTKECVLKDFQIKQQLEGIKRDVWRCGNVIETPTGYSLFHKYTLAVEANAYKGYEDGYGHIYESTGFYYLTENVIAISVGVKIHEYNTQVYLLSDDERRMNGQPRDRIITGYNPNYCIYVNGRTPINNSITNFTSETKCSVKMDELAKVSPRATCFGTNDFAPIKQELINMCVTSVNTETLPKQIESKVKQRIDRFKSERKLLDSEQACIKEYEKSKRK